MSEVTKCNRVASTFILCKVPVSTVDYYNIISILIQQRIQIRRAEVPRARNQDIKKAQKPTKQLHYQYSKRGPIKMGSYGGECLSNTSKRQR